MSVYSHLALLVAHQTKQCKGVLIESSNGQYKGVVYKILKGICAFWSLTIQLQVINFSVVVLYAHQGIQMVHRINWFASSRENV